MRCLQVQRIVCASSRIMLPLASNPPTLQPAAMREEVCRHLVKREPRLLAIRNHSQASCCTACGNCLLVHAPLAARMQQEQAVRDRPRMPSDQRTRPVSFPLSCSNCRMSTA